MGLWLLPFFYCGYCFSKSVDLGISFLRFVLDLVCSVQQNCAHA
jgi:hypothetical protein